MKTNRLLAAVWIACFGATAVLCEEPQPADGTAISDQVIRAEAVSDEAVSDEAIAEAVTTALKLVEKGALNYPKHRNCFSCHHQTMPALAMAAVRDANLSFNDAGLKSVTAFTHKSFAGRIKKLSGGVRIGGGALTVSYGLWMFQLAEHPSDEVTAAMVTYLLKTQQDNGNWQMSNGRAPLQESKAMGAVLSAYGMDQYATDSQREQVDRAIAKAKAWLEKAKLRSNEDFASRLWGLTLLDGSDQQIKQAQKALLARQRDDGGWAQIDSMKSDAYSTGQALWILRQSSFDEAVPAFRQGIAFLIKTREPDGSWKVITRAKAVQVFFDNGDPHGKHQFISTAATSWAVAALVRPGDAKNGAAKTGAAKTGAAKTGAAKTDAAKTTPATK